LIEIVEILDRAKDGVTEPFICRADDDEIYYVKGQGIGIKSLIHEWVAGLLAKAMGIPIAPFALCNVEQDLIDFGLRDDLHELGSGIAFASLRKRGEWIKYSDVNKINTELQQDLLMFDYWVKNGDRTLTEYGGNPNLLWDSEDKSLVVIDHNNAFDEYIIKDDFFHCHIFNNQWAIVLGDMIKRNKYEEIFNHILLGWEDIVASIPSEWLSTGEECIPADYDLHSMIIMLQEHHGRDFWYAEK